MFDSFSEDLFVIYFLWDENKEGVVIIDSGF